MSLALRELGQAEPRLHPPPVQLERSTERGLRAPEIGLLDVDAPQQRVEIRVAVVRVHRGLDEAERILHALLADQPGGLRADRGLRRRIGADRGVEGLESPVHVALGRAEAAEREVSRRVARVELQRLGQRGGSDTAAGPAESSAARRWPPP